MSDSHAPANARLFAQQSVLLALPEACAGWLTPMTRNKGRRRPRFSLHNQPSCLRRTTNVSPVPKPSARRRSNHCNRPTGPYEILSQLGRSWQSKSNNCSSVCGRSGRRSSECPCSSGNEAGGSIGHDPRWPVRRWIAESPGRPFCFDAVSSDYSRLVRALDPGYA